MALKTKAPSGDSQIVTPADNPLGPGAGGQPKSSYPEKVNLLELRQETKKKCQAMYKEASAAKEAYSSNWASNHAFYRGRQWAPDMPSYRVDGQMNFVQQYVERKAALLTDSKPTIKIVPTISDRNPNEERIKKSYDTAAALEAVISGIWDEHCLTQRLARLIVYAEVFGGCGTNTAIDRDRGLAGPDPTFYTVDPRALFFDPYIYTGDDLYKAHYIVFEDLKPTEWLKSRYPKSADRIKPDARFTARPAGDFAGTIHDKVRKLFGYGTTNASAAIDRTWVREYWIRDYSMSELNRAKAKRLGQVLPEMMDFPRGRHIIMAGDEIISDGENPYNDGWWPIDFVEWHIDLNTIWAFGDVELYKSPQTMINKMMSLMIENAQLMTNSIWIGDSDALAPNDWDKLVNEPGSHVKVRPGRSLKREGPEPISSAFFQVLEMAMGGMEKLSGLPDVMEGRKPGQVTSGAAIDSLQTAAQTVIRFKARQMEALLQRVGQKLISRIFQYMDDYRIFTITGDQDQAIAFNFDKAKFIKDPKFAYQDFRFNIVPGSSLAINKMQKGLQATQLHQMDVIKSRKRVLDAYEWTDRDAIEKENQEIDQKEMEQQMALAQASAAQSGPTPPSGKPKDRGTDGGPGGRRPDQPPKPQIRNPETPVPAAG